MKIDSLGEELLTCAAIGENQQAVREKAAMHFAQHRMTNRRAFIESHCTMPI